MLMRWEQSLEYLVETMESSSFLGISAIMLIICFKNCLDFKQKIYSSNRSLAFNFSLLLALGLGASIVTGILIGKTPAFMVSNLPATCYIIGFILAMLLPYYTAKVVLQLVVPLWMVSRHISAWNSDAQYQATLSFTGRTFLAFANYSGGLLFLCLFGPFDRNLENYISSSMHQSLIVNGTLSLLHVGLANRISKPVLIFILVTLQEVLKQTHQRSIVNAKIAKKKFKTK